MIGKVLYWVCWLLSRLGWLKPIVLEEEPVAYQLSSSKNATIIRLNTSRISTESDPVVKQAVRDRTDQMQAEYFKLQGRYQTIRDTRKGKQDLERALTDTKVRLITDVDLESHHFWVNTLKVPATRQDMARGALPTHTYEVVFVDEVDEGYADELGIPPELR